MNTRAKHVHRAGTKPAPYDKRRVLIKSAMATAVVVALAGAYLSAPLDANATATPAPAITRALPQGPISFAELAERVSPAVVNVAVAGEVDATGSLPQFQMPDFPEDSPFGEFFRRFFDEDAITPHGRAIPRRVQSQGSGFIIDSEGYIVTNHHVVDGAKEVAVILNDGSRHAAKVEGHDSKTDLALLKIDTEEPLPYVEFGNSDKARVGDWVLAVGNPFGLGGTVTAGIVSARGRDIHSGPFDDFLQIDAPINRGNSGGPLFDASGRVIGVNTAIFSPSGGNVGIGFAIPASMAEPIIAQLRDNGHIERGWLGVQIQPVTKEVAEGLGLEEQKGTLVASIVPGSPAAKAGLRPGDVIVRVDDRAVEDFKTLPRLIAETPSGKRVHLAVSRNGKIKKLPVVVGRMPTDDKVATTPTPGEKESSPRLGLQVAPLTPEVRQRHGIDELTQGVLVANVQQNSPAARAGIEPGSVISMVGQQQVSTPDALIKEVKEAIRAERPSVLLLVEQGGEKRFLAVPLVS